MKVKGTSKDPIKRCLEASQQVRLNNGRIEVVYAHNYTDDPNSIKLPKFGNWRSLDKVKADLRDAAIRILLVNLPYTFDLDRED